MKAKEICSFAIRPELRNRVDELAGKCGQSRSATIGRILAMIVPDLLRDDVAWMTITP